MTQMPAKSVARDVFLYLLMIFVLAWTAGSLGNLLFSFIDQYVPGTDLGYYYDIQSAVRFPIASLVIMFPVLVWVVRFLKRDMAAQPEKRELKIRRWLLYLTLFVTGLIVLGDLVTLVYSYLTGDFTLRFVLKVLTVFWLSGSTFFYFLKDLHNESPVGRRVVEWATIVLVTVALVAGFWIAGSPASQRAKNNDMRRVSDLQTIEMGVINYWTAKEALPATLSDLRDGTIGGSLQAPVDPKTGAPYEYRVTGARDYQLCATFESVSKDDTQNSGVPAMYYERGISAWQHEQGHQCFSGSIDPDRYPPTKR